MYFISRLNTWILHNVCSNIQEQNKQSLCATQKKKNHVIKTHLICIFSDFFFFFWRGGRSVNKELLWIAERTHCLLFRPLIISASSHRPAHSLLSCVHSQVSPFSHVPHFSSPAYLDPLAFYSPSFPKAALFFHLCLFDTHYFEEPRCQHPLHHYFPFSLVSPFSPCFIISLRPCWVKPSQASRNFFFFPEP